jgi:hypothetical protein
MNAVSGGRPGQGSGRCVGAAWILGMGLKLGGGRGHPGPQPAESQAPLPEARLVVGAPVAEQFPYRASQTHEMPSRRQFPGAYGLRGADPVEAAGSIPSGTVVGGMIAPGRAVNQRCDARYWATGTTSALTRSGGFTAVASSCGTAGSPYMHEHQQRDSALGRPRSGGGRRRRCGCWLARGTSAPTAPPAPSALDPGLVDDAHCGVTRCHQVSR